jgi:hypothetical protein
VLKKLQCVEYALMRRGNSGVEAHKGQKLGFFLAALLLQQDMRLKSDIGTLNLTSVPAISL